jgi:quercetin dioxygenase-like cupin family protein
MKLNRRLAFVAAISAVVGAATVASIALANPGTTTSMILAARSTFSDSVQVNDDRIKFQTKDPTDFVVQQVTFTPHANSGWHHHPGVILVLVKSGQVTTHDENCQTKSYGQGQAFVEYGDTPFMVSNESGTETAVDVAAQVAPTGSPFRIEDDPPPCA